MEQQDGSPAEEPRLAEDEAEPAPAPATATTIGARLQRARQQAGLSLAEVAERTKIRRGILADIEEGAHDHLPALTYTLGFVKAYARTIGFDAGEAAEAWKSEAQGLDPLPGIVDLQPLEAKRLPSTGLVLTTSFLLVLVLGGFWVWGSGILAPPAAEEPAPQDSATAGDTAVTSAPAEATESDSAGATADSATADSASAATEPGAEPGTGATASGAVPAPAASGTDGGITLAASNEVWLKVANGSTVLFTGILQPGQTITVPDGQPWLLDTGRAGALQVRVGNRLLPPLGGPVEVLHGLPLQADALLARAPASGAAAPAAPPAAPAQPANGFSNG